MKDRDAISEGIDEVLEERDSSQICVCGDPKHNRKSDCYLDDDEYWDDDAWVELRKKAARHHVDTQVATLNAQLQRAPLPPSALVGALQDRIGPTSGRLIAATPIRTNTKTPPQPKP